mmetsp:Transcript_33255/g.70866  ORF Transcript_33255/g.70866 Transcript_33255/m.70866 type:complete len:276 (-) Transcript_33255:406-1233(-)
MSSTHYCSLSSDLPDAGFGQTFHPSVLPNDTPPSLLHQLKRHLSLFQFVRLRLDCVDRLRDLDLRPIVKFDAPFPRPLQRVRQARRLRLTRVLVDGVRPVQRGKFGARLVQRRPGARRRDGVRAHRRTQRHLDQPGGDVGEEPEWGEHQQLLHARPVLVGHTGREEAELRPAVDERGLDHAEFRSVPSHGVDGCLLRDDLPLEVRFEELWEPIFLARIHLRPNGHVRGSLEFASPLRAFERGDVGVSVAVQEDVGVRPDGSHARHDGVGTADYLV